MAQPAIADLLPIESNSDIPGQAGADTLATGTVHVRNPTLGLWGAQPAWRLVEHVRIGSVDGTGPDAFGQIRGLGVSAEGLVHVLDHQAGQVRVFAPNGGHVRTLGRMGRGPGELLGPFGLRIDPADRLGRADDVRAEIVVPAVVAALELHDQPTAGRDTRDADRVIGRLGPAVREEDLLGRRYVLADLLGQLDLQLHRACADDVDLARGLHRPFADPVIGVAEDDRAEGRVEVDVLAPVRVPDPTPASAGEHDRRVERAQARRDPTRDALLGARGEGGGTRRRSHDGVAGARVYIVDNLRAPGEWRQGTERSMTEPIVRWKTDR